MDLKVKQGRGTYTYPSLWQPGGVVNLPRGYNALAWLERLKTASTHGLRTPNEGINQRNLNFWADMADK